MCAKPGGKEGLVKHCLMCVPQFTLLEEYKNINFLSRCLRAIRCHVQENQHPPSALNIIPTYQLKNSIFCLICLCLDIYVGEDWYSLRECEVWRKEEYNIQHDWWCQEENSALETGNVGMNSTL